MTVSESRLSKLYPALTAKERAILVLRASNQGKNEEPQVRRTMPDQQIHEFNRLIGVMNRASTLRAYIGGLKGLVEQLGLRWAWLRTLDLWAVHSFTLAEYIWFHAKEPMTESEHKERLAAARAEMVPVEELAELLTEKYEGWSEGAFDGTDEEDGEPLVSDAAWARVKGEKKAELAGLVAEGIVVGAGKGRRLRVNAGSFHDWLGDDVSVYPDWGFEFEVFSDAEVDKVDGLRRARERAREALNRSPTIGRTVREIMTKAKAPLSWADEIVEALEGALRMESQRRWQELVAVETVLSEVATEFDGEDPLEPDVREMLVGVRAELEELFAEMDKRLEGLTKEDHPAEEFLAPLREGVFG